MGLLAEIRRRFGWNNNQTFGAITDPQFFPALYQPDTLRIDNAETYLPIHRAINLVSNDVARLPLKVERKNQNGDWEEVDSPLTPILDGMTNSLQCSFDFRRTIVRDLMLYGNAFALISTSGFGDVEELVYTPPTTISQIDNGDGTFIYNHNVYGPIQREEILHFHLNGDRPFWGQSPIVRAAKALTLAQTQDEAGLAMYKTPSLGKIALQSEEPISSDMVDLLQKSFSSKHGAKDGHLQPIITQGGMKATQIGQSLKDSDWITSRRFSITEVARLYSIPPAFLFDLEYSTLENSGAQMRSYISTCLNHYLEILGAEVYTKLLEQGERLTFETTHLLTGTFKEEVEALRMALDASILSPNEARKMLGFEPTEGGDEIIMSKNYTEKGVNGTDTELEAENIDENDT